MEFLVSQKNRFFEEIGYYKFSPLLFTFLFDGASTIIRFTNNGFYFKIADSSSKYAICNFVPVEEKLYEMCITADLKDTLNCFSGWLGNIQREIQIEDKWLRLQQEAENINISITEDDSRFSIIEFELLKENLQNIKKDLYSLPIEKNKIDVIGIKLDHLLEQGKHLNKNDWKSLFIGTLISVIIQLSITHGRNRNLENNKTYFQ